MKWMDNILNGNIKPESVKSESSYHSPMDCPNMELKWDDGGCYPKKHVKYCEYCSSELWKDEEL